MTAAVSVSRTPHAGIGALALLLAATALAYVNGLVGPPQFDDHAVLADPAVHGWASWWATAVDRVRPLLKASYVATNALGRAIGDPALAHHLGGLAIHLAAVAFAFLLGLRVLASIAPGLRDERVRFAALVGAGMLALHPLATEAVTYVAGRSVSLATLFAFAALLCHDRSTRAPGRTALGWRIAALAAYAAAILARETTIVLPGLLLAWEWARQDRGVAPFTARAFAAAVARLPDYIVVAALAAAWLATHARYPALFALSLQDADGRMGAPSLLAALAYVAPRLVLAAPLSIDPDVTPDDMPLAWRVAASALVVAALVLAWRQRRDRPWWILAIAWIAIVLAPTYVAPLRHDAVSERHFYPVLWVLGLAVGAELASRLPVTGRARTLGVAVAVTAGVVLALATVVRNADYGTEAAMWASAAASTPGKARPFHNLGVALMAERQWDPAIAAFERALAVDPGYLNARTNRDRALVRRQTGNPDAEPEI